MSQIEKPTNFDKKAIAFANKVDRVLQQNLPKKLYKDGVTVEEMKRGWRAEDAQLVLGSLVKNNILPRGITVYIPVPQVSEDRKNSFVQTTLIFYFNYDQNKALPPQLKELEETGTKFITADKEKYGDKERYYAFDINPEDDLK